MRIWIEELRYEYPILIEDLKGVDILLSLDWLIGERAIIAFSQITAELKPSQKVALWDHPNPQAGYVKVWHRQTLVARHMTKVHCEVA